MKKTFLLLIVIANLFLIATYFQGYSAVYQISYGAFTLMAAMISGTFFWLWARRATPLALGMAFSWAGAASVMGWWWVFNLFGQPSVMIDNQALFLPLSLYFTGALMHFTVIQRSIGGTARLYLLPVTVSLGMSAIIYLIV